MVVEHNTSTSDTNGSSGTPSYIGPAASKLIESIGGGHGSGRNGTGATGGSGGGGSCTTSNGNGTANQGYSGGGPGSTPQGATYGGGGAGFKVVLVFQKVVAAEMVVLEYNLLSLVLLFGTLAVEAAEKEMVLVLLVLVQMVSVEMEELTPVVQVQQHLDLVE